MMFEQPMASCSTHTSPAGPSKRCLDDIQDQPPSKRSCNLWYFKLQSESSEGSEDDTESVNSIQGQETEFVQDTPDTDTKSENSDNELEVEYEIPSLSEEDGASLNYSSSDSEDIVSTAGAIAAVICNKVIGEESWSTDCEDTDDSKSAHETNTRCTDFWTCVQCNSKNNNPMYRYCQKCFQARKSLFPPRPKRRRRRSKSSTTIKKMKQTLPHATVSSVDSGIGSSQDLLPLYQLEAKETDKLGNKTSTESSSSSLQVTPNQKVDVAGLAFPEYQELCIMCNAESKNSIFLHGKVGHMCCCYKCAKRTWKTSKRCPICNCLVKNVIKVFIT